MTQFNINISNASFVMNIPYKTQHAEAVLIWILSVFEIPVVLLTLFALCFLIKSHRPALIYVTHLILSDLLQIAFLNVLTTELANATLWSLYKYSLIVSLFFMAIIAFERYILVSHPHWYRSHHSVKMSCFISFIIWLVPLTFAHFRNQFEFTWLSQGIVCFIPYIVIILCFVGTWRGLSRAISLTSHKRKLILASLSLVLLNYTLLILPLSITHFFLKFEDLSSSIGFNVFIFCHCLLYLSPLADCTLYLLMRSDAHNIIRSLFFCCRSPQSITARPNTCTITS